VKKVISRTYGLGLSEKQWFLSLGGDPVISSDNLISIEGLLNYVSGKLLPVQVKSMRCRKIMVNRAYQGFYYLFR